MRRFFKSFVYAKNGIFRAINEERNLRLDLVAAIYVYAFSSFYDFSKIEYIILTFLIGGVIAFELINTSIERAVYKPLEQHYESAGYAKDIAAGGVLVFAIASAVCGVLLFWDIAVFQKIILAFTSNIPLLVILMLSLVASYLFIFRKEDK